MSGDAKTLQYDSSTGSYDIVDLKPVPACVSVLDANADGILDITLTAGVPANISGDFTGVEVTGPEGMLTAESTASGLTITANSLFSGNIIIKQEGCTSVTLGISIEPVAPELKVTEGQIVMVGDSITLVTIPAGGLQVDVYDKNGVQLAPEASPVTISPAGNGYAAVFNAATPGAHSFDIKYSQPGTAEFAEFGKLSCTVNYKLENPQYDVVLYMPYFAEQKITLPETAPVDWSDFEEYSGTDIAGVGIDKNAPKELHLIPKKAGLGNIVFTDTDTGEICKLTITVKSLFTEPMFLVLAAAVPVCLIGFTVMFTLLIVKLKNRNK